MTGSLPIIFLSFAVLILAVAFVLPNHSKALNAREQITTYFNEYDQSTIILQPKTGNGY